MLCLVFVVAVDVVCEQDAVIPPEFPEWKETMDMWGGKMTAATFTLAEMAAVGFQMPADAFTSRMQFGPHLLAPTGSNFQKYGELGRVLAGFHYDLNFFTIHGKSRFPGLYVWTREGKKVAVTVPDGCLLVQAGKQIEHLTGGHVLAGFHEVVVTPATRKVIEAKQAKGESLWRVSSTTFSHIASDQVLVPLAPFDTPEALEKWPAIKAGNMVQKELEAISLAKAQNV
jgi:isopenicillin N synthase-like dioxygenase